MRWLIIHKFTSSVHIFYVCFVSQDTRRILAESRGKHCVKMCVQVTSTIHKTLHGKTAWSGGEVDKIKRITPKTFMDQETRLL